MAVLCPVPEAVYLNCGKPLSPKRADFSKPLHVDCSVEYELPSCAKLHSNGTDGNKREPLLMIHPSYYRREESRYRDPFIINLPTKMRSLHDWKVPIVKNNSTVSVKCHQQHRKRILESSPLSSIDGCSRRTIHRPVPKILAASSSSKESCPCGKIHQLAVTNGSNAALWSTSQKQPVSPDVVNVSSNAIIEDLRVVKNFIAPSPAADSSLNESERIHNDKNSFTSDGINDKFRKLRRVRAYTEQKRQSSSTTAISTYEMRTNDSNCARSLVDAESSPAVVKKAKKETFSSSLSSSFECCVSYPSTSLYEPQKSTAATPSALVPITPHWNCGGYFRTAGANAISTIVRDSENMWRLFQV